MFQQWKVNRKHQSVKKAIEKASRAFLEGNHLQCIVLYPDLIENLIELEKLDENITSLKRAQAHFNYANALGSMGHYDEALKQLHSGEQCYLQLNLAKHTDVHYEYVNLLSHRATLLRILGKGVSTLLESDAALFRCRTLYSAEHDDPHTLTVMHQFALHAKNEFEFGDMDLAVASADFSIQLFHGNQAKISQSPQVLQHFHVLALAASIASQIHNAAGRNNTAIGADEYAVSATEFLLKNQGEYRKAEYAAAMMRRAMHLHEKGDRDAAQALLAKSHSIDAESAAQAADDYSAYHKKEFQQQATLRNALAFTQKMLPKEEYVAALIQNLTRPAMDTAWFSFSDRVSSPVAPNYAILLFELSEKIRTHSPTVALRLGLEAHLMLAKASREQVSELRHPEIDLMVTWRNGLQTLTEIATQLERPALATEFSDWKRGIQSHPFSVRLDEVT